MGVAVEQSPLSDDAMLHNRPSCRVHGEFLMEEWKEAIVCVVSISIIVPVPLHSHLFPQCLRAIFPFPLLCFVSPYLMVYPLSNPSHRAADVVAEDRQAPEEDGAVISSIVHCEFTGGQGSSQNSRQ